MFFLGIKNCLVLLTFPYPVPVPKNCVIFIGCNFESRASQVGLQKGYCVSKGGNLSKTWPRATENFVQVTQPGDMLESKKARIYYLRLRSSLGRFAAKKNVVLAKKLLRSICLWHVYQKAFLKENVVT